jgi:hypothetical protein
MSACLLYAIAGAVFGIFIGGAVAIVGLSLARMADDPEDDLDLIELPELDDRFRRYQG